MRMPRFLQPFRRRDRGGQPEYGEDPRILRYDSSDYEQPSIARSGSRWRSMLPKGGRQIPEQRNVVNLGEYSTPPTEVGRVPMVVPPSRRARVIDDYSDSSITGSDSLPVRYPRQGSGTRFVERASPHGSFLQEPGQFVHRVPSQESFHPQESIPPPLDQISSAAPSFVAPPGEVFMEEPRDFQRHENISEYTQEPPVIQGEPRRFRARRGEPITVGGVRIEVEDEGGHERHRGRRSGSRARSIDSYSSGGSRSYTSASSFEEQPIIISADPDTEIEIGNERDGFVPYEQYLAEREARRRARRHHHRRTPEEEVYVVPAGANVIFVDEDGRELHRFFSSIKQALLLTHALFSGWVTSMTATQEEDETLEQGPLVRLTALI
ncbi:hypothetical protein K439DRAFT_1611116 [Ramaria rubella]|nr:hypothetical protein K439DRAFT_1611116 [Ramaria rubella]